MARKQAEDGSNKYLLGFLACAAVVAMFRNPHAFGSAHGWIGLWLAVGGWFFVLKALHREALGDQRPPRPLEGDPRRLAVPALIGGVFWVFGWVVGVIAILVWWGLENKRRTETADRPWYASLVDGVLEGSPEMQARISTPTQVSPFLEDMPHFVATARVTVVDLAVFLQTLFSEDGDALGKMTDREGFMVVLERFCRPALEASVKAGETDRQVIAERWRQALLLRGLKAESVEVWFDEVEPGPAPVAALETPIAAEAVVQAAPVAEPVSSPVADLFAQPEPDPFSSTSAPGFSSASEGFEEVLAKLQGKPSPGGQE